MKFRNQVWLWSIPCILFFSYCGDNTVGQLRGVTPAERLQIARDTANYTYIKWIETNINFGTIKCGDKIKLIYRFKNVGEKPLFIIGASEGCKCATTEFNSDPIQPGKQGAITIHFDSKTQLDAIRKSVIIEANAFGNRYQYLVFTGRVRDCCGGGDDTDDADEDNDMVVQ